MILYKQALRINNLLIQELVSLKMSIHTPYIFYQNASFSVITVFTSFLLGSLYSPIISAQSSTQSERYTFPDSAYATETAFGFFANTALQDTIDPFNLSIQLLSAAIHYTTNQERKKFGLRPMKFYAPLRNMAQQHANAMTRYNFVDHINPYQPGYKTVPLRSKRFKANAVSENVASSFLHMYKDGDTYYRVWNSSKNHYEFFLSDGRMIKRNTYLSFARQVVKAWMGSKGHRRAILKPDHTTLGCSVQIRVSDMEEGVLPLIYCTQNFGMGGSR